MASVSIVDDLDPSMFSLRTFIDGVCKGKAKYKLSEEDIPGLTARLVPNQKGANGLAAITRWTRNRAQVGTPKEGQAKKPCYDWQKGVKCTRGKECSFGHETKDCNTWFTREQKPWTKEHMKRKGEFWKMLRKRRVKIDTLGPWGKISTKIEKQPSKEERRGKSGERERVRRNRSRSRSNGRRRERSRERRRSRERSSVSRGIRDRGYGDRDRRFYNRPDYREPRGGCQPRGYPAQSSHMEDQYRGYPGRYTPYPPQQQFFLVSSMQDGGGYGGWRPESVPPPNLNQQQQHWTPPPPRQQPQQQTTTKGDQGTRKQGAVGAKHHQSVRERKKNPAKWQERKSARFTLKRIGIIRMDRHSWTGWETLRAVVRLVQTTKRRNITLNFGMMTQKSHRRITR
eukprot:gb/GEZN01008848.1/.p1 GENE.gb/GEZN01008848.1/~~gb/GEZN01008848.1/.p1  ORF type:complete len:461 (-),score=15.62 gb/GEZN01008848.1/:2-1195(-)